MYIVDYFKSFFDFKQLTQSEFFVRYITLVALSALIISIDEKLLSEVNIDFVIVPEQAWTNNGYFFKKIVSALGLIIFWLGLRRFKDILNVKSISVLPFSFFILLSIVLSFYGFEMFFFLFLFLIPNSKRLR